MKAEIISIGTELLLGHTVNTDAAIVARLLAAFGIDLQYVQTVGDNGERLRNALELASSRAQIIITTGGLGPTDDDLSKQTVAAFANLPLVEYPEALAQLKEYFGPRQMSANQIRQAWLPQGSRMLPNKLGTAPGCAVPLPNGGTVIMLPGPPRELVDMLEGEVRPLLESLSSAAIHTTILRTFGIGEGVAAQKIADLMANANPTVAPYAHGGEMFVKISAKGENETAAKALCEPVAREVEERLGEVVYGRDVKSLEELVVSRLVESVTTIATAESCTGGLLAKRITDQPGASAIFHLGIVSYSNGAKEEILHIDANLLAAHGAVSPEVARAMAENVRKLAHSDLGIGITGIAGPTGATPGKPLGLVYVALASPEGTTVRKIAPLGRYLGREFVRERAASHALDLVRRHLAKMPLELIWQ